MGWVLKLISFDSVNKIINLLDDDHEAQQFHLIVTDDWFGKINSWACKDSNLYEIISITIKILW